MFRPILGSRVEFENSTFWTTLWKLLGEQSPARQLVRSRGRKVYGKFLRLIRSVNLRPDVIALMEN